MPPKTHRVEEVLRVKSIEAPSIHVGVVGKLKGSVLAQISSSSLDIGSDYEVPCSRGSLIVVAAVAQWYRYRIVAGFVTSSSPVPLKTRRVGQRCTLNLRELKRPPVGVVW
ncbi:hypothetical protein TNCV_1289051 [Trichonephila clavipes]|nr:hypothetical protein TNCV_1289051 [Trichonephila clavipes]